MEQFNERYGPWALVTGASSGIGAEFARQLAARGLNVALVARRRERLGDLAAELEPAHGIATRIIVADLAREDFLPEIRAGLGDVDVGLLINNAGFGNTGNLLDNDLARELELLHVNCRAVLMLAHEIGRHLRARGRGGMIFVSSTVGFTPTPIWSNYSASKAYDLFLGEGLAAELGPSGVDVLTVCPGATRTEFQVQAALDERVLPGPMRALVFMSPEAVVRGTLDALGRKRTHVPGWLNALTVFSGRLMPRRVNSRISGLAIGSLHRA